MSRQSGSNCEYVHSVRLCVECTRVGMFVYVCVRNKVHLATELSSGAPGVSVAHVPTRFFAAAVLLSGDTPARLNGPPQTSCLLPLSHSAA